MHRCLLPMTLAGLLSGCTLALGTHECDQSADCPVVQGQSQICTADHLCSLGTPPENLCTEVYTSPMTQPGTTTVPIGFIGQLSGVVTDKLQLEAVELGVDQFNNFAGTTGRTLVLHYCDSAAFPQDALTAMEVLTKTKSVVGVVGPTSSREVLAVSVQAGAAQVPVISPAATSPAITSVSQRGYVFRMPPSDSQQGPELAKLLSKGPTSPQSQIALLYVNDAYGMGLQTTFLGSVLPSAVVVSRTFTEENTQEVAAAVQAALTQNAKTPLTDVVVIANRDAPSIMLQLNVLPATGAGAVQVLMADAAESDDMLNTFKMNPTQGANFARLKGTAPASVISAAFKSAFSSRWNGDDPSQNSFTSYAYDSFFALAIALGNAQGSATGQAVSAGFQRINSTKTTYSVLTQALQAYQAAGMGQSFALGGVTGPITFNGPDRVGASYEVWSIVTSTPNSPTFMTVPAP